MKAAWDATVELSDDDDDEGKVDTWGDGGGWGWV